MNCSTGKTQLGVFAKYWQPNQVKTRLAATIGAVSAARIYRQFVVTLLSRFANCAATSVVCFWPPDAEDAFRELNDEWCCTAQVDGNLGERMRHYFQAAIHGGYDRIVLIGSDSPDLPNALINEAFEALLDNDVVLGPTVDGGYYLVGLSGDFPQVFDSVPWSTPQVWDTTLRNIEIAGLRFAVLPNWYDVDELADLRKLCKGLQDESDSDLAMLRDVIQRELNDEKPSL